MVNASNLKLPFWLFNFEELVDVLFGGKPALRRTRSTFSPSTSRPRRACISSTASRKTAQNSARSIPKRTGYTVDTPVPYIIQDLVNLIDERMGRLENRATRMHYHRLLQRIESLRGDSRYAFMFENANVGGDTMGDLIASLFRLEPNGQQMTVLQVAGLPIEVVDAVVCVVARLAFDFGLWSDGAIPMVFVCEEAHRFAPADRTVGFAPTRRALLKIAKEGRKYGVYLGLVTQRPSELDPDHHFPVQHAVRDAPHQRTRPGDPALDGHRFDGEPARLRALARHPRSRGGRRRLPAAGAHHLPRTAARPGAAQRDVRARRGRLDRGA